jgi:hypothetical protein
MLYRMYRRRSLEEVAEASRGSLMCRYVGTSCKKRGEMSGGVRLCPPRAKMLMGDQTLNGASERMQLSWSKGRQKVIAQPYARVLSTRPPLFGLTFARCFKIPLYSICTIDYLLETKSPHEEHPGIWLVACGVAGKIHQTDQAPESSPVLEATT